jgi:type II secretory pathway predicted ATPase ExeA
MSEEYVEYWGLARHPFLMAPDSRMMCVTGQYYECLERVKYAINTSKGGVLIVSEDAGLGKTTLLLKLIDDMKEKYRDAFRYAYVDHPTLSASQMIAQITGEISGVQVGDDKLKNLNLLKEALIYVKEQGGKSIIIVDEGQLLCEAPDVLQELRILINLTYNNEYLHTFILSGQRALWYTVKNMPEFWQRLPVRFYFVPLKLDETKELVQHRLWKAGLEEGKEVFSVDALEIIHRYSRGSPRTVMALADLSLLVGYTNQAAKIGFKEVSKAISAMSGQGESLPYVAEEEEKKERDRGPSLSSISGVERSVERPPRRQTEYSPGSLKTTPMIESTKRFEYPRPLIMAVAVFVLVLAATFVGYHYASSPSPQKSIAATAPVKKEPPKSVAPEVGKEEPAGAVAETPVVPPQTYNSPQPREQSGFTGAEPAQKAKIPPPVFERTAVVVVEGANLRSAPGRDAPRVAVIFKDQALKVIDQRLDRLGYKWYMVRLYGDKEGWISDEVVELR